MALSKDSHATQAIQQPERRPRTSALRNRAFGRYLGGFGFSLLGDQIWFVALAWAASRLGDSTQTSLVIAAGSIPRAVLLLLGGTLADRFGALPVALRSQVGRIITMAVAVTATLAIGDANMWVLLGIAVTFGALDAAHMPAVAALPPQLLDNDNLPSGQGLVQTLERAALVAGAPVGGLVVALGGLSAAAATNLVLFTAALVVLRGLRLRAPGPAAETTKPLGTWHSLADGLRYAARDPVLRGVLIIVTVLNLGLAGPLNVGLALLAKDRDWNASRYGWTLSAFAAGAVAGALLIAAQRRPKKPAMAGLLWVAGGSLALASVPLAGHLLLVMAAVSAVGFASGPASALLLGLVQARTKHAYLGRIMALINFSALGLTPVSYTLFGLLADLTALSVAFLTCAGLILVATCAALGSTAIRTASLSTPEMP